MHNPQRVFGLDVLRAIAILLVLKGHAKLLAGDIFKNWISIPLIDGVELFFVLSGFLIGGQILKSMQSSSDAWSWKDTLAFLKRRWYRTLPNYYLILLVQITIVYLGFSNDSLSSFHWSFFVFCQNFLHGFQGFFWESWSLSVEEWFYLLFPIFLLATNKLIKQRQAFLISLLLMLIVPFLLRLSKSFHPDMDWYTWDVEWRKVVVYRLDAIAFGLLAAFLSFFHSNFFNRNPKFFFAVGMIVLIVDSNLMIDAFGFYERVLSFSIKSLGVALTLPLFSNWILKPNGWFGQWIEWTSKISYSMYLINLGVVYALINHFLVGSEPTGSILPYILFWVLTFALSHLLYRFVEIPWMKLRDRKKKEHEQLRSI